MEQGKSTVGELRARLARGEYQSLYEELIAYPAKSPEHWHVLAMSAARIQKDVFALECFAKAEASGFPLYWIAVHRAPLRFRVGDHAGAVRDAAFVIEQRYLPHLHDLLARATQAGAADPDVLSTSLGALHRSIRHLHQRLEQLSKARSPRIIKVQRADFVAFCYEGDGSAHDDKEGASSKLPAGPVSAAEYVAAWRSGEHHLLLLAHHLVAFDKTAFLDIGANIGAYAMLAALLMRRFGRRIPIVAFEPGVLRDLLPYTVKFNGLQDEITAESLAVGDEDRPMIMFSEANSSGNARLVNRDPVTESESHLVDCTRVDSYLARAGIGDHSLVLKIDTQGAEWLVWQGLRPVVERAPVSMLMEFSPSPLQSTVDPVHFVRELCEFFHVVDVGATRDLSIEITPDGAEAAVADVRKRPTPWTDFVCIGRSVPGAEALLAKICERVIPPA